jgi:hypothetical protein
MTNKALKRGFLMIAGILSVIIIVLTQSYYQPVKAFEKKSKTEHAASASDEEGQTFVNAPSDMVPNGSSVAVNETPSIAPEKIDRAEESKSVSVVVKKVVGTFLKTLFRVVIAPNAP